MDTSEHLAAISFKGDNFRDFLFTLPAREARSEKGSTPFRVDPFPERIKSVLTRSSTLKSYLFSLR